MESYSPESIEKKWQQRWVENGTYSYDGDAEVYAIDTPPPTVSGSLHMGHLYQHTLQDFAARFRRMSKESVLFPFGYDDNGIASERLTEKELGVEHQDFSRREFQEKCREVCRDYEDRFTEKMQGLGFSMDWSNTYKTISPEVQRTSQLSFIDLYEKDREYREEAPTIWCPECGTAISQVEMEDDEEETGFYDIEFDLVSGGGFVISTTRPELLPACVAVFVHPDSDESHLAGEKAEVPLFGHEVPIMEDERVDMETGSGIVMCCTFGDQTDIEWYRAHDLDLRVAIDENGRMTELAEDLEGMSTDEAGNEIVDQLEEEDHLVGEEQISHTVRTHERCDHSVEFRVSEQWYIEILDRKEDYLEAGREMDWYPEKMFTRYRHWIEGLEWDWIISRQRDSGIPFPVWYCEHCDEPVLADKDNLPVGPIEDDAPVDSCPGCGHGSFEPERDVLDTWATSSLTPLINAGWDWNPEEEEYEMERPQIYPANLRPQGHDIISFWLFNTIVKCVEHTGETPFDSVLINGHVLNENREKMSKSKGNYTPPGELMDNYSTDGIRYWCTSTSVGNDFPLKRKDIETGEKVVRKIWNASKLVNQLTHGTLDVDEDSLKPVDRWMKAELDQSLEEITGHMHEHRYDAARRELRQIFWHTFCDDYLEVAKQRLQNGEDRAAEHTLRRVHEKLLRAWAPILPHITEEVYSEMYSDTSVHLQNWPQGSGTSVDTETGRRAMKAISALRQYKNQNDMSLSAELGRVEVLADISGFEGAVADTTHADSVVSVPDSDRLEKTISSIGLDYETLGPKLGDDLGEVDDALDRNDWSIDSGHLRVAGHMIAPENFTVEESREYTGEGDHIEADGVGAVVK